MGKKKLSNKAFLAIMVPALAVGAGLIIGGNVAANYWSQSLDTYLGRGERLVSNPEGSENWDVNYYEKVCPQALGENGSLLRAAKVTKKITDEGIVLLKNSGQTLPLAKNSNVVPFGYRYKDPVYGGTGSGAVDASKDYVVTSVEGLAKHFNVHQAVSNKILVSEPEKILDSESASQGEGGAFDGADLTIFEFNKDIYDGLLGDAGESTAIIYIGRISGEGGNLSAKAYTDGTPNSLALSTLEKETIKLAKQSCKKTVAVIDSSNIMQIDALMSGEYECDAILWIGGPGSMGFDSLADILVGEVNPSGRTVDIWERDVLQNPSIINFGDHKYAGTDDISLWNGQNGVYFYEYEEGVYYGYRYYETAAAMDNNFVYGEVNADGSLKTAGAINYPFGYGLSYTTFEQKIVSLSDAGDSVKVTVEVSNKGSVKGKEVVQLYYTAPYTDFDKNLHVEKPVKTLLAFDKVEVAPNGKQTVTLEFDKEEMASYAYRHDNGDGTFGCYLLEEGDYTITLGKNSHDAWDSKSTNIASTIYYTNANPRKSERVAQAAWDEQGNPLDYPAAALENKDARFVAATNHFDEVSAYMESNEATILSRADWAGTQPSAPNENKTLSPDRLARMRRFDYQTDPVIGESATSVIRRTEDPVSGKNNSLKMIDMRGVDYFDTAWNDFLDQIDYTSDQPLQMIIKAFGTGAVDSLGKPATSDHDGPQGIALTGTGSGFDACAYCSEPLVAATFNVDLAYEYGDAIGEEALNIAVNGWYGPGANLHRSPLNGRNFEYYSEDPVLTGKIGAKVVSGAEQKGLVVYLKHFGWHTYEGVCTSMTAWMTEQAYRETDMKAFEIIIKESRKTLKYNAGNQGTLKSKVVRGCSGIMGAATHVGTEWQAANYNLTTLTLRGEWGFQGLFSTDMGLEGQEGNLDKVIRSGGDLRMHFMPMETSFAGVPTLKDKTSSTFKWCVRRALKNVCFAYANSNIVQGAAPGAVISYKMSPWRIGLIAGTIVLSVAVAAGAALTVLRILRSKKKANVEIATED
ncbi:MAG: glycoside hydrolase family 3 C-terminal domain-containing protein [Bacilli bacterium]|nr:glycoside hydrolase family 3 C-terminal domain-containing protein [Bacilli bacterium]